MYIYTGVRSVFVALSVRDYRIYYSQNKKRYHQYSLIYLLGVGKEVRLDVLPLIEDVLVHGLAAEGKRVAVVRHGTVHQPQTLQLAALRLSAPAAS